MAKSKPIGVRFDLEKLELIQKEHNLKSPQAVLNFLTDFYGKSASNLAYKPANGVLTSNKDINAEKRVKNDKKQMPLGLSSSEQIQWKIDNL